MTRDKIVKAYAKQLLKICLVDGVFSEERAAAVLQVLERNPPRRYLAILRAFHALVEREVAKSVAVVEHAGALSPAAESSIRTALSARYERPIALRSEANPSLIAGVRVRVADDVFESSIAAALEQLQATLSE